MECGRDVEMSKRQTKGRTPETEKKGKRDYRIVGRRYLI
jgi:hypothetical protein